MDLLTFLLILFVLAVLFGGAWHFRASQGSLTVLEIIVIVVLLFLLFDRLSVHRHYFFYP